MVGIPLMTPKSEVMHSSFCGAYHAICLEKYAKVAIMPSSCVLGGYNNEDLPLHKLSMVKQQAAEWKLVVATTLSDDSSTSRSALISLFHP